MKKVILFTGLVAMLILGLTGKYFSKKETVHTTKINLKSGNFFFEPNIINSKLGDILEFEVDNKDVHTFVINELNFKKELVEGKNNFTLKLDKKGIFTYYCDLPGHREGGQFGTLFVE